MRPDTLGIVGLGAMGGSIAWQAVRAGVRRVLGCGRAPAEAAAAARAGALTEAATSVEFLLRESDLVILAVAPGTALDLLGAVARHLRPDALCTDVAAVKAPITFAAAARGLGDRFAGSHPLLHVPGGGFAAAAPDRFRGAVVYVTPATDDERPGREVADFWRGVLAAEPVVIAPAAHDAAVAWTAQLPQIVAAALAAGYAAGGPRGVTYGAAAREATRWAARDPETWRDLLLLNREAVLQALDGFDAATGRLRRALADGDAGALADWLDQAAAWRRRLEP